MTISADLYLLYTVDLEVGDQQVHLNGGIKAGRNGLEFALSTGAPFDTAIIPSAPSTQVIHNPLGLTGVDLVRPQMTGAIRKGPTGGAEFDLAISATATFPRLPGFSLTGAVVFKDSTALLGLAVLTATPKLTLTAFLSSVFGGALSWAAPVTDQFAFGSALLYMLRPPAGSPADYTYTYQIPGGASVVCRPGYRVDGSFRIFDRFDFTISLTTVNDRFTLTTTVAGTIDIFDFIALTNTRLEISNAAGGTYIRIATDVTVLSTPISGSISADYDTAKGGFGGRVSADLGRVAGQDVRLTIAFVWSRQSGQSGGLKITEINGLPAAYLDMAAKFRDAMNAGGGCRKILTDWLNSFVNSAFRPGLNGSPTRDALGRMNAPLKLTYELKANGSVVASSTIDFTAVIAVPRSLDDLPQAILDSIEASAGRIAEDVLSDPDTYKAVAMEAARIGGQAALARFICNALEKGLEQLAKSLAAEAGSIAAGSIAGAAELAAQLVAVSLLGIGGVVGFLMSVIDTIKSWFGGGDDKKEEAEDKIREERAKVEAALKQVDDAIADLRRRVTMATLTTALDDQGRITAQVTWPGGSPPGMEENTTLVCSLDLLTGSVGDRSGTPILSPAVGSFPLTVPLTSLPPGRDYRMNARARAAVTGTVFMDSTLRNNLNNAIGQLRDTGNGVAESFANYLEAKRNEFEGYNTNGIAGDWTYATSDVPEYMTVGGSRIGFNTRLRT